MDQKTDRPRVQTATVPPRVKGTRPPNEIDFWRGYALVAIFLNHIPGLWFEKLTHRNFGFSDSAELFVLLAGWSMRSLADRTIRASGPLHLFFRLGGRAIELYVAQLVITIIAIAIIAATAFLADTNLVLQWHNAAAVFEDPATAHIGLAMLTHQLGYFDILPLYVVLMAFAPFMTLLHRYAPTAVLPLSLLVYGATLTSAVNLPTWPVEGRWFFNPLAWQLIFVIGFTLGGEGRVTDFVVRRRGWFRALGALIVALGVAGTIYQWYPDPLNAPSPVLFFVADKTFLTPLRLLHVLGLVALVGGAFVWIFRWAQPLARFFSMLGRNSLNVFCVGSLLSLAGQVVRFVFGTSLWVDGAVLIVGLLVMSMTAWVSEWRARLKA
ncbi:MAG TPA: OpgC domain-containing protein [Beijerinckiaceae bacterium]